MTIFEVFEQFLEFAFTEAALVTYATEIDFIAFILTLVIVFGFFLIPLWKLGTFFLYRKR